MKRKKRESSTCNQDTIKHTLENRSTISSHVNQTGKVNDPSLSHIVVLKVTFYCHGMVREVHKNCMKLQTSSESNASDRDICTVTYKNQLQKGPNKINKKEKNDVVIIHSLPSIL